MKKIFLQEKVTGKLNYGEKNSIIGQKHVKREKAL